jgi:hypothetical protein
MRNLLLVVAIFVVLTVLGVTSFGIYVNCLKYYCLVVARLNIRIPLVSSFEEWKKIKCYDTEVNELDIFSEPLSKFIDERLCTGT